MKSNKHNMLMIIRARAFLTEFSIFIDVHEKRNNNKECVLRESKNSMLRNVDDYQDTGLEKDNVFSVSMCLNVDDYQDTDFIKQQFMNI